MENQPGLYDEKDNLIFSWQELIDKGLNVKENYLAPNTPNTLYSLLKSNNLLEVNTKMVLPEGITSIGAFAISGCFQVKSIILPNTIESINPYMFWCYKGLENIKIPDKIKSIGSKAFSYCESLYSARIPDKVKLIDSKAFSYCENLERIRIPESVESIGQCAFEYCKNLKSVEISNPDVKVGENIFAECENLEEIFAYKKVSKNNPNFANDYKDKIKYVEDMSLDELLNKEYTLAEAIELGETSNEKSTRTI